VLVLSTALESESLDENASTRGQLMVFVVGSALAAEEFFVVQHPETKNCEISNSKGDANIS